MSYIQVFNSFGVNFCIRYKKMVQFHSLHVIFQVPNTIYWRGCLFSVVYSRLLHHKLIDYVYVCLPLGSLLGSINPYVCFPPHISYIAIEYDNYNMKLGTWCLQLCYSFSRFLWLFRVFCGPIQIWELFLLFLWKMSLEFW